MGANTFFVSAKGATAREAFDEAVRRAKYDHGHAGYTGTIAEKHEFVEIATDVAGKAAIRYAHDLIDAGDERVDDKWGPAGAIKLADGEFLFFGWASS